MIPADHSGLSVIIPILLYVEVHYRFPFFPLSRYYRREPEIIADAPRRIDPGAALPLLILVKDAHLFPVHLETITIKIAAVEGDSKELELPKDLYIEEPWWHEIVELDMAGFSGECSVSVLFNYRRGSRQKSCVNHNVRGSGHPPLSVFVSSSPLPGRQSGWHWGDLHCHTWVTEDFVEFGAPLDATGQAARAAGLSFLAITDHSYDIDDVPGSWKETDPDLSKWHRTLSEIDTLNRKGPLVLIPGEELSVANSAGKNVHALVLNHPDFLPGSGDSGERWFVTRSEHYIQDLKGILRPDALGMAAHPGSRFSFPQRLFLNRSVWQEEDFRTPGISGFEILNGSFDGGFHEGLRHWIGTLLEGRKTFIYAGNDAHGNFNRFRQIKTPAISVWDHSNHVLGKCRTGIHLSGPPTLSAVMSSLMGGKCVISDGPLIAVTARSNTSSATLGESISESVLFVDLDMESTAEFGVLVDGKLYFGDIERGAERLVSGMALGGESYRERQSVEFEVGGRRGYIRAELTSRDEKGTKFHCYTNPIWVNQRSARQGEK